jgi:nucleoside-diphosphate-sugar epimerase
MRFLVTGANGFIGAALCRHLVSGSFSVHGLVRAEVPAAAGVVYHVGSLEDGAFLRNSLAGVDCVIHLAGRAHVMREEGADPLAAFRAVNRDGTLHLARIAQEIGVKRFVFISSIGVNGGETAGSAFTEDSQPAPHADYAVSKLEAEEGLRALLAESSMELVIIRPPLVYGIGAPGNFARLIKLISLGLPLPFGMVDNRRSLISLDNLVDFITFSALHPRAAGQLFLVSDGNDVSTPQMVRALARGMGRKPLFLQVPEWCLKYGAKLIGKETLYKQLCGSLRIDSAKARDLLGWSPKFDTQYELEKIGRLHARGNL